MGDFKSAAQAHCDQAASPVASVEIMEKSTERRSLDCRSFLIKAGELSMRSLTGVQISRKALYQAPPEQLIQRVAASREISALKSPLQ
jgi:hypothetical protein